MLRFVTSSLVFFLLSTTAALAGEKPAPAPLKLRVLSFNLYNHPWERAARLENTIDLLRKSEADVVLLQEVARGLFLPGDPSMEIAEALQFKIQRFWHEQNWGLFRTGVAVLSRYPIVSSEYHDFAAHGFWNYKGYMLARIALPGGKQLQVVNLHMASTTNAELRRAEWDELQKFVMGLQAQGPVLIAGDFNTLPTDPALLGFVRATGVRSLYDGWKGIEQMRTWTPDYRDSCGDGKNPESELVDYFFALPASSGRTLKFAGGRIIVPGKPPHPSDHCPVQAELEF